MEPFKSCEDCGCLLSTQNKKDACDDCLLTRGHTMLIEHRVSIDFCLKNSLKLSDSDSDFIDKIDEAANGERALTVKDQAKLRSILEKLYKIGVKPK